jgi:CBS domain-containing protein
MSTAAQSPADPSDDTPGPRTDDTDGLTVADVMHADVASMPPTATVGELRDWFALSRSRRLVVIADDGRYVASLTPSDVGPDAPADQSALEVALDRPTIAPDEPARTGLDLISETDARRIPVVDDHRRFRGVLAVTSDLQYFACRPSPTPGRRAR